MNVVCLARFSVVLQYNKYSTAIESTLRKMVEWVGRIPARQRNPDFWIRPCS